MANLTSTVDLIFRGTNLVGSSVNGVLRDVDRLNTGIRSAVAPVALLSAAIVALEVAAARFAITFAKNAFDASLEFSRAQTELNKVLGDSEGQIEDYTQLIFQLSNQYGVSSVEVLSSIAAWKQAGFTAKEAGQLTKEALDLVIAGDIEAERASELLIRSIKGFGLEVQQVHPFLDTLNSITNNYGVNLDQLGEGMSRVAPLAELLGFSYGEIAGLLTPVIEQTQNAEISSRGFRTAMLRLADPTGEVAATLAKLGVETRAADGSLLSVKDIVTQLGPAFNSLTDAQQGQTASILAGKDQAAIFSIILRNLEISAQATATGLAGVGSSIDNEVNTRFESAGIIIDRTAVAFNNLQITIGRQFQGELAGVADGIGEILRTLGEIGESGGLDAFFDTINPSLVDLERIARQIAEALPEALANADYSGFERGIESLIGDLAGVNITADDVASAITGVANTFESLARFTDSLINAIGGVVAVLGPIASGFGSLDPAIQSAIVGAVAAAGVFTVLSSVIGGIITVVAAAASALPGLAGALVSLNTGVSGVGLGLAATTTGLASFTSAIGLAAGATGVGYLVYQLGQWADLNDRIVGDGFAGYRDASVGSIFADIADSIFGSGVIVEGVYERQGDAAKDMARDVSSAFDEVRNSTSDLDQAGQAANNYTLTLTDLNGQLVELKTTPSDVRSALSDMSNYGGIDTAPLEILREQMVLTGAAGVAANDAIAESSAESSKTVVESAEKAIEASEDYRLKMAEIASDERIQIIKAKFEVDIARLEGDTKQVVAAFESIDNTVNSTGDLIGSLFGELSNLGRFEQLSVFDQIEKENRRRQEALDLQKKLVDAQIAKLNAQTRSLQRGNALINVDASPLAPHLQSILHEVLKQIQLTASADMMEFLLNVDPDAQAA